MILTISIIVILFVSFYFYGYFLNLKENKKSKQTHNQSSWEIVHRDTERWTDLGFGDGDDFPGYGKLFKREFKYWYCEIGSKTPINEQTLTDIFPMHYDPKGSTEIIGENVFLEKLQITKGFEALYTALDNENRKRWYFALISSSPTGIETTRSLDRLNREIQIEEIEIPQGYTLISNHTDEWEKRGYYNGFPGYGKISILSFDIWYTDIGLKEKVYQTQVSTELALYGEELNIFYFERICREISEITNNDLKFERLTRTQGYIQLYKAIDRKTKRNWYLGVTNIEETKYFTARSNTEAKN